jgi:hypothetical protein
MAEKRKPAKMANRNVGAETIKDDGDKYVVLRDGVRVYGGSGVALGEAVRLATSLASGAGIGRLDGPGAWTQATMGSAGVFIASAGAAALFGLRGRAAPRARAAYATATATARPRSPASTVRALTHTSAEPTAMKANVPRAPIQAVRRPPPK